MAPIDSIHLCVAPFQYYECSSNGFFGCCTQDPCQSNWCPDFEKPPDSLIFWKTTSFPSLSEDTPTTVTPTMDPMVSVDASSSQEEGSTAKMPSTSPAVASEESVPTAVVKEVVLTSTQTQELYVVFQTSNVLITPQALKPTILTRTITWQDIDATTTVTTSSSSSGVSILTAQYIVPVRHQSNVTNFSTSHTTPWPLTHAGIGTIATVASLTAGLGCYLIFKAWSKWNMQLKMKWLGRSQHDDHPMLAGRDANQAGNILSSMVPPNSGGKKT